MIKEKIKTFSIFFKEEVNKKDVNFKSITKEYYNLLKDSDDYQKTNSMIIGRINPNEIPKYFKLEKLFNKSKELNPEELESKFSEELNTTIIESLGSKNSKKLYSFNIKEAKNIIKEEIMDWDFFKTYFDSNVDYWKIKEAIGWIAAYVETEDYNPERILQYDGKVLNKKQTLKNILIDINKKSLTDKKPFLTKYDENKLDEEGNFNFRFCPASSGEIDVMVWSEKKQKAIASSVTRHRGVEIEGNQFIRHYMKMLAMTLDTKSNQSKNNQGNNHLTRLQYRNYIKSNDYKSLSRKIRNERKLTKEILNEISENVPNDTGGFQRVRNDFLKDLIIVRLNIKKETGKDFVNNKDISKKELEEIIKIGRKNIEYNYFGEILKTNNKAVNEISASFNSFAYVSNYKDIGNVKLGLENATKFLKEIKFNYNAELDVEPFQYGIKLASLSIMIDKEKFKPIAEGLSRGKVFSEERNNFYKSIQNIIKTINESENKLQTMKDTFCMKQPQAEELLEKIKEDDFINDLKMKFDMIKINQSETTIEKDSTINIAENLSLKLQKAEMLENKEIFDILKKKKSKNSISCQKI
jgi:hypothetical protein